jgi:hypothetical protein
MVRIEDITVVEVRVAGGDGVASGEIDVAAAVICWRRAAARLLLSTVLRPPLSKIRAIASDNSQVFQFLFSLLFQLGL